MNNLNRVNPIPFEADKDVSHYFDQKVERKIVDNLILEITATLSDFNSLEKKSLAVRRISQHHDYLGISILPQAETRKNHPDIDAVTKQRKELWEKAKEKLQHTFPGIIRIEKEGIFRKPSDNFVPEFSYMIIYIGNFLKLKKATR